jgi:hypothetical protein
MHDSNREFWQGVADFYPGYFSAADLRVLEVGSLNVNGSLRDFFGKTAQYVGVDWREGENVDVVCKASQMSFDERFHTVVSASMLEHDPEWLMSIVNMVSQMREDGILILTWGAALNKPHCGEAAIDDGFHPLAAGKVLTLLETLGVQVAHFSYEDPGFEFACLVGFKELPPFIEPAIARLCYADQVHWRSRKRKVRPHVMRDAIEKGDVDAPYVCP